MVRVGEARVVNCCVYGTFGSKVYHWGSATEAFRFRRAAQTTDPTTRRVGEKGKGCSCKFVGIRAELPTFPPWGQKAGVNFPMQL